MRLVELTYVLLFEVTDGFHHFRHVHLAEVFSHLVNLRCHDVGEIAFIGIVAMRDVQLQFDVIGICRHGSYRAAASGVRDERFVPVLLVR